MRDYESIEIKQLVERLGEQVNSIGLSFIG